MLPKAKFRGKLIFCMMGTGKTYLANQSADITDTDKIYCDILLTTPAGLLDMMRALAPKQHGLLHRLALKCIREELDKGNTVLTGSTMFGKHCHAAYGFDDPALLVERAISVDRPNRKAIKYGKAQSVIDRFFAICEKNGIPVTDIGYNYLSKYLLT